MNIYLPDFISEQSIKVVRTIGKQQLDGAVNHWMTKTIVPTYTRLQKILTLVGQFGYCNIVAIPVDENTLDWLENDCEYYEVSLNDDFRDRVYLALFKDSQDHVVITLSEFMGADLSTELYTFNTDHTLCGLVTMTMTSSKPTRVIRYLSGTIEQPVIYNTPFKPLVNINGAVAVKSTETFKPLKPIGS